MSYRRDLRRSMITENTPLPLSPEPINGVLHIRPNDKKPRTWELYVGGSKKYSYFGTSDTELNKLPAYPLTHPNGSPTGNNLPGGIGITLIHGEDKCLAAFHGFGPVNRYNHRFFYIGSRGYRSWPNCRRNTAAFQRFLSRSFAIIIGTSVTPIPVKIEFRPSNTIYII